MILPKRLRSDVSLSKKKDFMLMNGRLVLHDSMQVISCLSYLMSKLILQAMKLSATVAEISSWIYRKIGFGIVNGLYKMVAYLNKRTVKWLFDCQMPLS